MPATRSGFGTVAAIAEIEIEEVLLAMIASGAVFAAISPNTSALVANDSVTASTTSSQLARCAIRVEPSIRESTASRSALSIFPFMINRSNPWAIASSPRSSHDSA